MQCKWHVNSWLHSKFKFCYLELPRIFFQIFFILAWLNPWMWNLQVLRADYIHFLEVFLASVILDLALRTIKLSNWSLAHGHQARDSICHPSLKWDMNEGKWCMEPLVTSLKIKSLMQDLLFFPPCMLESWQDSNPVSTREKDDTLKMIQGISLVVQWVRLCVSTAEDMGSIPGQGTKILQATLCGQKT